MPPRPPPLLLPFRAGPRHVEQEEEQRQVAPWGQSHLARIMELSPTPGKSQSQLLIQREAFSGDSSRRKCV